MIITEVSAFDNKRRKVYIDGEYAFPLYLSEIRKYHIQTGMQIDDAVYNEIYKLIVNRIKQRICYLITDADKSEQEIRRKMRISGYSEITINEAVNSLIEYGYIDDYRYAVTYAESLRDNKGKSRQYIQSKLYEKGISKDIIEKVNNDIIINEDEQIMKAIHKKGYSIQEINSMDFKSKQKLYAFLARKGFSSSNIKKIFQIDEFT